MSAPFRLVIAGPQDSNCDGVVDEVRVDIVCRPLQTSEAALDNGDDYFCTYGPTATQALAEGLRLIAAGVAELHFREVARLYPEVGMPERTS